MVHVNTQPRHQYKQIRQNGNAQQGNGQRQGDASQQQRRDEPRRVLVFRRETQADFGDFAR